MAAKLLFDEDLAPRLVREVADLFPGSAHVAELGLGQAADEATWGRAASGGPLSVTKDDDFRQRSFLRGHPPKVAWLRIGNCSTTATADVLRARHGQIQAFPAEPEIVPTICLLEVFKVVPTGDSRCTGCLVFGSGRDNPRWRARSTSDSCLGGRSLTPRCNR